MRLVVAGGVLLLLVLAAAVPVFNTRSYMSPVIMELAHTSAVKNALGVYARDHDGKFPRTLDELLPDYAEFFPSYGRQFHDPVTKQAADWIYYGGYTLVTDDTHTLSPSTIIVASPSTVSGHERIVVYADTSAAIIEENAYALNISRQLNDRMPPQILRK